MTREEIIQEYEGAVVANGLAAAAGNEDAMKSYELFKIGDGYIADNITHWMPLPAPPDRRPTEGEDKNV